MLTFILSVLLASSASAHAQKVAATKLAIREEADAIFLESWSKQAGAQPPTLSPTLMRSAALWVSIGSSIGGCKEYARASLRADWITKLDQLPFGTGPGGEGERSALQEVGDRVYNASPADVLDELTDSERRTLCSVELEASQSLLNEF